MRAEEVLRRYATGERNFQGEDLRGQNFSQRNLADADFSGADIRGTNFAGAVLRQACFRHAIAGLQRRWILMQWLAVFLISGLTGILQGFLGYSISVYFFPSRTADYDWSSLASDVVVAVCCLVVLLGACVAIARQGFTIRAFSAISMLVAVAGSIAVLGAILGTGKVAVAGSAIVAVAVAVTGSVAVAVAVAIAGLVAIPIIAAIASSIAVLVAIAIASAVTLKVSGEVASIIAGVVAGLGSFLSIGLGIYIARQVTSGKPKFAVIRSFFLALATWGGTRFEKADLTQADFTGAILKSTNFRQSILSRVGWRNVKGLERSLLGNSILADATVRDLLITGNGYKKTYVDANLQEANLNGFNLQEANLKWANLSNATLQQANLKDANLREVLAIGTDLTNAYLTGACLEAWNIDAKTKLSGVDCQYVFLLETPDSLGSRERRPHDPDRVFAPGDFEKLYTKMMNLVQVLLKNGVNREAFAEAFQQLMDEHPEISYDSIQSIERKGKDVLMTLEVPETADKAEISHCFLQPYEHRIKELEAHKQQLEMRATDLRDIALALAAKPIVTQAIGQGTAMQETYDSSRNVNIGNIGGDFTASEQALNLGEMDISGTVTNAINQLPDEPSVPTERNLKQLLTQLQQAIQDSSDLSTGEKTVLLEQVKTLAEVKQTAEPERKAGMLQKVKGMFEATLKSLPDTADIVEACSKLLPLILIALGFPV